MLLFAFSLFFLSLFFAFLFSLPSRRFFYLQSTDRGSNRPRPAGRLRGNGIAIINNIGNKLITIVTTIIIVFFFIFAFMPIILIMLPMRMLVLKLASTWSVS